MKRVALIGMPNTGKSTLFNKISGSSAKVGNWPGVTVDLLSVKTMFGGELIELIDLPGIYGLSGYSEDEKVVADFIKNNQIDHIFYVANSTQLDRQLELMLELKKFNIPLTLVANMIDEAKAFGIEIDFKVLEQCLQTEIIPISAKYGQGFEKLHQKPKKNLPQKKQIIELDQVVKKTIHYPARLNNQNTKKLDALFLNPAFGLPIFLFIIFGVFQFVFSAGQPIQEWMSNFFSLIQENYLIPLLSPLNSMLQSFIIDGVYAGLTTVAAFVPIIILFFFIMTIIEDSGYFSRAAFLMDKIMEKMGLDGRAFVMMLMGFGCNVPALMGTKIMRTKEIRFLTMLVIPFSLCSARLQVFLFLIAAFFSPTHGALVLFSLYLLSFFSIFITAIIFKNKYQSNEPLVLELPPYRFPTTRQILLRGWHEVKHFLNRASKFIVLGVIVVWALTHFPAGYEPASEQTYAGVIGNFFHPIFDPIGIDQLLVIALIFGFIAKEILIGALAVIFGLEGQALSSHLAELFNHGQAISFMIFTLIYTPCLSTIATLKNESKDRALTILSIFWSLGLAWLMSFIFYQIYLHI
jgi:ferrous iron transport protein B